MGSDAGLHADQARWRVREPSADRAAHPLKRIRGVCVLRRYEIYRLAARRFRNPRLCSVARLLGSIAPARSMEANALLRDKVPLNRYHRRKAPDF
jgi:hypothetical protein